MMEIYRNNTWQRLCTNGWDKVEENLTCMAMGYHQTAFYENCSFHETKNKDTTNTYMYYNCTKLTNCEEKLESKCSSAKVSIMKGNLVLSTELIT